MKYPQLVTWPYVGLFAIIFLLDRFTKYLILQSPGPHIINDLLTFQLSFNKGVSWGMLNTGSQSLFIAVSLVIVLFTIGFALYTWAQWLNYFTIYGEVMVLAGAVSNVIDRLLYGGVADFIVFALDGWSWPAFNIADAAIVVGVGMMLITSFRMKK